MQSNNDLIDELVQITRQCTDQIHQLKTLSQEQLNQRPRPEAWSALECLEHLNRYGEYYLPAAEKALAAPVKPGDGVFHSGWIGNWFSNLMKVKDGKITKLKSPADKNPAGSTLTSETIDRFLDQQDRWLSLLEQSRAANLVKAKVPITIAPWLRLRLGDTLRFNVYHIERHVLQAMRAAKGG